MSTKKVSAGKTRAQKAQESASTLSVEEQTFGPGKLVSIKSSHLQVSISTLGATLQSVKVLHPKKKLWIEVNVHYTAFEEALEDSSTYFGATVGRFAGRISNGKFVLNNVEYNTPKNAGEHTVHGGGNAFDKKQWSFETYHYPERYVGVRFFYRSPHMENGFPADVQCSVYYWIGFAQPNALHTEFDAFVPQNSVASSTIVNMFNHSYWNLNGIPHRHPVGAWEQPDVVHNHLLRLPRCRSVIETDSAAVPSGRVVPATPALDFTAARRIGEHISCVAELNRTPCGYDHPYRIDKWKRGAPPGLNAVLYSPHSEIKMDVYSTFPCIWVYTANNLKEKASGEKGQRYGRHTAVCLEPQHYPDAINHEFFPQSTLNRGERYEEEIINVFTIQSKEKPSKL